MQKDTRTEKKTLPSSLCRVIAFSVPVSWQELTQEQLRHVIRLLWLYGEAPDWEDRVATAAFLYFAHVEVARHLPEGWLCRERSSGKTFLLSPELLPSCIQVVSFVCKPEEMADRIEIDGYDAYDFELQELPFGNYLELEGYYQSFLLSRDESCLQGMARVLYRVPEEDEGEELKEEVLTGAFLWFGAAKQLLSREFPNFLKPASAAAEPVSRESLIASMRAQMRLLTKGDVTKEQYVRDEVDTWTALAELDASAKEAEEIERKYGKK